MIENFAQRIPSSLLPQPGMVFFSGRRAFSTKRGIYLLGINPGGDHKRFTRSVQDHTKLVLSDKPEDWSEYRDEEWGKSEAGAKPFQKRVCYLFKQAGYSPGEVPSSNLIFQRSRNVGELRGDFNLLAEECWPFHEAVITELEPKVIVCLGGRVRDWVCQKLSANVPVETYTEANNRKLVSRSYSNKEGVAVVGLAHPGRVAWNRKSSDPTGLVCNALSM